MKTSNLIALVCALSLTTVACSKSGKKEESNSQTVETQKAIPEGQFEDVPYVMTSDYYGQVVNLAFDGDVTSFGEIKLHGADAKAMYFALNVEAVEVDGGKRIKVTQKIGPAWACKETKHIRGVSYSCEMSFDYKLGTAMLNQNPASTYDSKNDIESFDGTALSLSPRRGDQTLGRVDLTGQDARVIWYSLNSEEAPANLGVGSVKVHQKTAGEMTCWKTWIGEYVSFNCRVGLDWNTATNLALTSMETAAQ